MNTSALTLGHLDRCRDRESEALAELYKAVSRPVLTVALAILGDQASAEDVLHDVYLKVVDRLDSWHGRGELMTWVYRITVNECLGWRRKVRRRLDALWREGQTRGGTTGPVGTSRLEAQQFLAGVDPETRSILVLKYVEGLTFEEIATITGRPVGTLKSLSSRALKRGAKEGEP